ncbi:MAG: nucleotidyltransferase [Cytophagales bacterium]|nr:nucleotidyltransferase [Cytophagales bacterium]
MKPTLLVLAAGMGSRYGGLKQIDQVGPSGETIIEYSVYDAIKAGFGKVVFVIRRSIEEAFKEALGNKFAGLIEVDYAIQEIDVKIDGIDNMPKRKKPWGTGHALLVAASKINAPFAVINADDFYGSGAFKALATFTQKLQDKNGYEYAMVGYVLKNTLSDYGSVSRGVCETNDENHLIGVTERTKIQAENGTIYFTDDSGQKHELPDNTVVSMNFWGFTPSIFNELRKQFIDFVAQNTDNPKAEFYIPLVVNNMIVNDMATIEVLTCEDKWFGITYKEDKEIVKKAFSQFVSQGVYPSPLWR